MAGPLCGLEYGTLFNGLVPYLRVPTCFGFLYSYGRADAVWLGGDRWFKSDELRDLGNEPKVLFYSLEGSWFMDWNWHENNMTRALLATPNYGLAAFAKGGWDWDRLAIGAPLADTMRAGLRAYQSILGDPTLRMRPMSPVTGLRAERDGTTVTLRWNPCPEPDSAYYVYRSYAGLGGFGAPLNSEATPHSLYVDTGVTTLPTLYQVRVCRLVQSGGSYFDLSQGLFLEVQ